MCNDSSTQSTTAANTTSSSKTIIPLISAHFLSNAMQRLHNGGKIPLTESLDEIKDPGRLEEKWQTGEESHENGGSRDVNKPVEILYGHRSYN